MAQTVEEELIQKEEDLSLVERPKWKPPPKGWNMCNIAYDWSKKSRIVGLAWVVRNDRGVVLLHSRNSVAGVKNREEAKLKAILWAVEILISLSVRLNKIVFAGQFEEEFGAVMRLSAWPSFAFQGSEIMKILRELNKAQLLVITREMNRDASFISQSVTREEQHHSYVISQLSQ